MKNSKNYAVKNFVETGLGRGCDQKKHLTLADHERIEEFVIGMYEKEAKKYKQALERFEAARNRVGGNPMRATSADTEAAQDLLVASRNMDFIDAVCEQYLKAYKMNGR